MEYEVTEKFAPNRDKVEVLGATYEAGKSAGEELGRWRHKLASREEKLRYLETAEHYWYGKEWYGSEKRKNPA